MLDLVDEYLTARRSLGYALRIEGAQLRSFARFADAQGHRGPLRSPWSCAGWRFRGPGCGGFRGAGSIAPPIRSRARSGRLGQRGAPTRAGGRLGSGPFITSTRTRKWPRSSPPHARLVQWGTAWRNLCDPFWLAGGDRAARVGGTSLTQADVDLGDAVLRIRATKFRKSRLVPLHPTAAVALGSYAARRDRAVRPSSTAAFFVGADGMALAYSTIRSVFLRLRRELGWAQLAPAPRIHDLRHTFACRRLRDWYATGADVAPLVASLATYLGHAHITDTYWYLTGTPDLLARAADRFAAFEPTTSRDGGP